MTQAVSEFNQQALSLVKANASAQVFKSVNDAGAQAFADMPFPTRKTESWKYTSLHALTKQNFNQAVDVNNASHASVDFAIDGLDALELVFVNGQFQTVLSSKETLDGLQLVRFSEASAEQLALIEKHLAKNAETERNLFTALNNAQVNDGVFVLVSKNTQLTKPVKIVNISTPQAQPATAFNRCLVILEQHAQATVIEQFVSSDEEQNVVLNQVSEMIVGDGAHLNHYRLHKEHESSLHFGGVYVDLNRDSQFTSYQVLLGGQIKRFDVLVNHNVGGSHCEMKGVYLPKNDQHVDIHSYIEHKAPNCTTNEVYRGIMADRSKAVFNGRIHIHPDAQKTLAELSNKNLLLSDKAQINTKPELEIYADDVKCAHGATVAQLNETAKFYLQSRGISAQEADIMLSFGFINELLESIPLEALRVSLRPLLAQQFSTDKSLTQHILADDAQG
ncbi:Fe-S cluster assembly protein SufD [Bermanella sp. WJH001]|uniref:Fe-S cluster assembly protein SufD n=1 Tax=Bermanella sp. WJH001 TaxID=3048005 RepID=UPI0024BE6972|nr:Fe-S cluster assembly protein SufD [Bermanella sp. WJH001]MDJ1538187.1 Fe-S cluster assembly protein SufD [Bermanella sp. WJH001]